MKIQEFKQKHSMSYADIASILDITVQDAFSAVKNNALTEMQAAIIRGVDAAICRLSRERYLNSNIAQQMINIKSKEVREAVSAAFSDIFRYVAVEECLSGGYPIPDPAPVVDIADEFKNSDIEEATNLYQVNENPDSNQEIITNSEIYVG